MRNPQCSGRSSLGKRLRPRGTIETIYGMIVTQAEPLFYRDLGVPDTTGVLICFGACG
jgi:hypothetical protein